MRILSSLPHELRQAVRRLAGEKGFSATTVLTLALCLAANVVIFTVLHSVVLKPLPFPNPDRLVVVYNSYPKAGVERAASSWPNYYERKDGAVPAFAAGAAVQQSNVITGDSSGPHRAQVLAATPGFLDVLGIRPAMGRFFQDGEELYSNAELVVLTHDYWQNHFQGDPDIIGKTMQVNELPREIIGVLPPGFRYLSIRSEFLIPLAHGENDAEPDDRHNNNMEYIARLRPDATLATAQAQIDALNARMLETEPFAKEIADAGFHTVVQDLHEEHVAQIRPALMLLQAGVLFLLLIGIVNLINLLLIRATTRARELALRQILGAGRDVIAMQVICETLLLAFTGAVLGIALGAAGLKTLGTFGVDQLPLGATVAFDPMVALFALVAALVVGLLLALPIIWFNYHGDLAPVLNTESRGGTTSRSTHRLRHTLIVAQIALTFILLSSAGLLGMSFSRVLQVPTGFRSDHLLTASVSLPWGNYRESEERFAFMERLLEELRGSPGVTAVGLGTRLPVSGGNGRSAIWIDGREPKPGESIRTHFNTNVGGDYFGALGVPLREGRFLNADDGRNENRVCVVDSDFVEQYWPGESALGRIIYPGPPEMEEVHPHTIVGVVSPIKYSDLADDENVGALFYPFNIEDGPFFANILVRTQMAPEAAGSAIRQALARVDPRLPLDQLKTMETRLDETLTTRRGQMMLAWIFSVVALVLAALGIYGVLAYAVTQRTREIGVRMALGALPEQILRQFLGLGTRLLLVGVVLGLAGSWFVGRLIKSMLFEISPLNGLVLGGTAVLLATVVLLASFLPSRRAASVTPIEALRAD